MARRRRGRGRKMNIVKRALKTVAGAGGSILIAGPVLYPGVLALQNLMSGGNPKSAWGVFTWDAAAIDVNGAFSQAKLPEVLGRDVAFVGMGLFLRWIAKRV